MARTEEDREDLMQDATAYVRRAKFCDQNEQPIIVGFRNSGFLSIYFDQDPVFHFDDAGRLRRAFVDGALFRTQDDTLARMDRERSDEETALVRHDLTSGELVEFRKQMFQRLGPLLLRLANGSVQLVEQIPSDVDLKEDLKASLTDVLAANPWLAPQIKGKP